MRYIYRDFMRELPLSVAISALVKDGNILLIKRARGDYAGLWGMPGGKIEKNEHLSEAAVREIREETGIESEFRSLLGFVSEHLVENGSVSAHLLLHVCELFPLSDEISCNAEGQSEWFSMDEIESMRSQIIPSDFLMIEKFVKSREGNYYNCILEKVGDEYKLRKFE